MTIPPASRAAPVSGFPAGCNAALSLTFDADAETGVLMAKPSGWRDAMAMTHQAFGPKVGVSRGSCASSPRRRSARTFFVPGWTARRYPDLIATSEDAGTRSATTPTCTTRRRRSPDEERRDFERALTRSGAGRRRRGYRAAWWQATWHTLDLLAEYGFRTTPA